MADDYNSDYTEAPDAAPEDSNREQTPKKDSKTALLPIPFFQGKDLTPGSVCSVRVEAVLSDQVQVSYVPHAEEEYSEGESTAPDEEDMMA